jgi:signal transduction histidine kinase
VESTAYFVVAEALTNAAKHARAGEVTVRIARRGDLLVVEVADDGSAAPTRQQAAACAAWPTGSPPSTGG